jgi:hypothetical protein
MTTTNAQRRKAEQGERRREREKEGKGETSPSV